MDVVPQKSSSRLLTASALSLLYTLTSRPAVCATTARIASTTTRPAPSRRSRRCGGTAGSTAAGSAADPSAPDSATEPSATDSPTDSTAAGSTKAASTATGSTATGSAGTEAGMTAPAEAATIGAASGSAGVGAGGGLGGDDDTAAGRGDGGVRLTSIEPNAAADGGRSSGALAMAWRTAAATAGDTPRTVRSGTSTLPIRFSTAKTFASSSSMNGAAPVSIVYTVAPSE